MKMIKRIGILAFIVMLFMPIGNVFAADYTNTNGWDYTDGLLDDPSLFEKMDFSPIIYDNDVSNETAPSGAKELIFNTPVNLDGLFIVTNGYVRRIFTVNYYDQSAEKIASTSYTYEKNGYNDLNIDNVLSITFDSLYSMNINEFDLFGEVGEFIEIPVDSDGDGIPDSEDEYPDDPTNTPPPDSDGDGIPDSEDEYPDDPTNTPPPETTEEVPEVEDLQIEAEPERVDLSWKKPPKYFEKATIYRKTTGTVTSFNIKDINPFAPMTVHAAEEYEPLFETNGTTFSDLSVNESEEYEYKVTNTYNGIESNGVTIQATIPKPPLIDLEETSLPFGVKELIESGNGFLGIIGGFVLLALSFIFVPKLIKLIRGSIREKGIKQDKHGNRIHFQSEKAKAYQSKEKQERVREKREREQGLKRDEYGNRIHFRSKESKAHLEKSIKEMKPPRSRFQRPKRESKQERQPRESRKGRRSS